MVTKKDIKERVKQGLNVGKGYKGGYSIHCKGCNYEADTKKEVINVIHEEIQEDSQQHIVVGTYCKEFGEWSPSEGGTTIYNGEQE